MSDQWSGIDDPEARKYLEEQAGPQKSAVWDGAYRRMIERLNPAGGTPTPAMHAEATEAASEAERRNVYGWNYKKDRNGNPIQQGLGAKGNENFSHFQALQKRVQQGFEPPNAYTDAVKEIWKRDPGRAAKIGLQKPIQA
jgi:hypothetical protein